ncbi:MAG: PVC-type heme-binding CxxCH protein [Verrucomicrobiota bacterium]
MKPTPRNPGLSTLIRLLPGLALALGTTALEAGPSGTTTRQIGAHTFTVPEGFQIEAVATTDQVARPVNGSLDDQVRLYVTDSSGSTEAPAVQAKNPQWRVIRLEDTNGDGRYDRSVVFADKLPMLQGILWHQGSVYVGGTPAIWKLTDADGDGRADRREEWWNVGHPSTHCGNEVHGPYAGPDGLIYWTKGAFEPVRWTNGFTGTVHQDKASHIFRARPDGSAMESVMTGGMDNPVDVVFNADGDAFFTSTFIDFSQPGFRDGVAHASYGAVFGKANSVLEDRAVFRPGPALAHPIAQLGAAAPSGLAAYDHEAFGPGFRGDLFASAFNLRKISRIQLEREGASFKAKDSDFVVSSSLDFHPTDVLADADGSVLILDTGGWYKLCCPSSQLWKADVLGGVYRVTRVGAKHTRPATPASTGPKSELARIRRLGDRRDPAGIPAAMALLNTSLKSGRRDGQLTAITALARLRHAAATPLILRTLEGPDDETLRMAATAALAELRATAPLRQALEHPNPKVQAAALQALEQIPDGGLRAEEVGPALFSDRPLARDAALWVAQRHADWGEALAGSLRQRLLAGTPPPGGRAGLTSLLGGLISSPAVQTLMADLLTAPQAHLETRHGILDAMAQHAPKNPPESWGRALTAWLEVPSATVSAETLPSVLRAARSLTGQAPVREALLKTARNPALPAPLRLSAYAALPAGWQANAADLGPLLAGLRERQGSAAEALARATLEPDQLDEVARALPEIGPLELTRVLPAFERGPSARTGESLLAALGKSKARTAVRPEMLRAVLKGYPAEIRVQADRFLETLDTGLAGRRKRLEKIRSELPSGDVRRGQAVFNSPKAACIQCHRLGYQGGDVGPELTSVGTVRSADDLLEAIVEPSASLVRSYEPVSVTTRDGEERLGILRRDDARGITLVTGPGSTLQIDRADITAVTPSTVSLMPAGLDEQITRLDLADLLEFLKNTRWGR